MKNKTKTILLMLCAFTLSGADLYPRNRPGIRIPAKIAVIAVLTVVLIAAKIAVRIVCLTIVLIAAKIAAWWLHLKNIPSP